MVNLTSDNEKEEESVVRNVVEVLNESFESCDSTLDIEEGCEVECPPDNVVEYVEGQEIEGWTDALHRKKKTATRKIVEAAVDDAVNDEEF